MRLSVDIGGTFTDLVTDTGSALHLHKAPTVPSDPARGIFDALHVAESAIGLADGELLRTADVLIHATTRGLNAVLTGTTARTAFLTTAGHPDVLLLREGGRPDPFDFTIAFPRPFVPRSLTYEVPGRIAADGQVIEDLDHVALDAVCRELAAAEIEAVGVCLLWSTINSDHELAVGAALAEHLPGVPYTLSHRLNPSIREYRRASSTCIDAALKPIMTEYLADLDERVRRAGFAGRLLIVTSIGGVSDVADVAAAPILSINSGPSMAPVGGRVYAEREDAAGVVIVADAGGTTFDVTLVRNGQIPWTRSAWIGQPILGHMTGLPSVDVKSVGAGGGSIAWVDAGGLLHVGPRSAGSEPGPACYRRGGTDATVTDAAVVLGFLDPDTFSGGAMRLDADAAAAAIQRCVGDPLGLGVEAAASAVMELTSEQMVHAIEEVTLQQGIDPAGAVLVAGGGAGGLNAVAVARRLGCERVIVPGAGAALAAAGALMSDLSGAFALTVPTSTSRFAYDRVNAVLEELRGRCHEYAARAGVPLTSIEIYAEARYPQQIWELEVPVEPERFEGAGDVEALAVRFHTAHEQTLGVADPTSDVEVVSWGARVRCSLPRSTAAAVRDAVPAGSATRRRVHFGDAGALDTEVRAMQSIAAGECVAGPALVASPFTTVVVPPRSVCRRGRADSLIVTFDADAGRA